MSETGSGHYLPFALDVGGMPCLVVGGGKVGARRATKLAEAGAQVTVLAPEISASLRQLADDGKLRWEQGVYDGHCAGDFALVVAATSDAALNERIGSEAEERGILCCVASNGRSSRLLFPASFTHDGMTVAVHSNGRDPRRSIAWRDRLRDALAAEDGE